MSPSRRIGAAPADRLIGWLRHSMINEPFSFFFFACCRNLAALQGQQLNENDDDAEEPLARR